MNLYQMKSNPSGIDRMGNYLKDNFVSIGWPGIGDLDNVSRDELEERLIQAYPNQIQQLNEPVNDISTFVHGMQDGDYLLMAHGDAVYVGDVGDYYYVEAYDSETEGTCHRRGVTWLIAIRREELNAKVQELLSHPEMITKFTEAYAAAQLEGFLMKPRSPIDDSVAQGAPATVAAAPVPVDKQTIQEALHILKEAMGSEDAERRERAAVAILQYAKSGS